MQIATVHKLQRALDTSKKVIKFAWRHALTLIVVGMIVAAFAIGKISWVNSLYFCIGAVFLDWFKMQFKSTSSSGNLACKQMFESAITNSNDFSWKMNPINPMGYTHHIYNHRSTNNYY